MQFIAQIDLSFIKGYKGKPTWAYLFMSYFGYDLDNFIDGTWAPDMGENCLLLQPGNICYVETEEHLEGPPLCAVSDRLELLETEPCEFRVELTQHHDPEFIEEPQLFEMSEEDSARYYEATIGNKIGGTPKFEQGDEFPGERSHDWLLVLQLDMEEVPFYIDLGDVGKGYAFVKRDGTEGRFLWQCG